MLHRIPDFTIAVLACWLGLSLWLRAPRDPTARTFAWLCLTLTLYGLTPVLSLLTDYLRVAIVLDRVQVLATVLAPVAFLHFMLALVGVWPPRGWHLAALLFFYTTALLLGAYALFGPVDLSAYRDYRQAGAEPFQPWSPWGEVRLPSRPLVALWAIQRVAPLLLALWLMAASYRGRNEVGEGKGQRLFFVAAAVIGVLGALEATVSRIYQLTPAVGRIFIVVALAALAYAVLAYRSLLPPRVARRAFLYSLLGGLITIAYVAMLLALEALMSQLLGVDAPVLTAVVLVALVAVFGPLRDWMGKHLDRRFFRREFNYSRLIGSLSSDLMSGGDLDDQFAPLLSGVCRNIGARSGLIAVQEADTLRVVASYGVERLDPQALHSVVAPTQMLLDERWDAWPQAQLVLPLSHEGTTHGLLALGPRRANQPYHSNELRLLRAVASYLVVAVAHQRVREQEQRAVAQLAEQGRVLREQQERLARLADEAVDRMARESDAPTEAETIDGLRVYCLGPLRVERDGMLIERWGGDKAGTYQAEALFAFLFDRRQRGLTKDEAAEVIWPELEIKKADTAFHRTLGALRRTLEPELRRGNESRAVPYHHDRYWLDPALVVWSDVDAFEQRVARGLQLRSQGEFQAARVALDEALGLYRGPYMDSTPFFGDSVYVEDRRTAIEGVYVEAQLALAALLEQEGRTGEALRHYRLALQASGGGHARAEDAIQRLSR